MATDPRRFLPLTHLAYAVLLCLAEEPAHGYALVERIRTRSGGLINPGTGSFYSIVKKLSDEMVRASKLPDVIKRIRDAGAADLGGSSEDLAKHIAAETLKWKKVVEAAKLEPQ